MKIIKYGADWCNQCKALSNTLNNLNFEVTEIDVEANEDIAEEKGIRSIPYTEFFNDKGILIKSTTGLLTMEQLKKIKEEVDGTN